MKRPPRYLLLSALFSAATCSVDARPDTDHTPRDGDRLHPGLADSRSLILSVSDSARTVLLDTSGISFDEDRDAYCYVDGDTISYVQSATKHSFLLRGDTMSYLGYENRATDFRLDAPTRVVLFPLHEGASVSEEWSGVVVLRVESGEETYAKKAMI